MKLDKKKKEKREKRKRETDHAAPLVIPPCFANSFSSESQPGVRGFDILVENDMF